MSRWTSGGSNGRSPRTGPELAIEVYCVPLLACFRVAGASGVERWVEDQQGRLTRRFARRITADPCAMGRHQPRVAVDRWLRLAEQNPFDVRAISGLLHACLAAGDRPNAIRYAERHIWRCCGGSWRSLPTQRSACCWSKLGQDQPRRPSDTHGIVASLQQRTNQRPSAEKCPPPDHSLTGGSRPETSMSVESHST